MKKVLLLIVAVMLLAGTAYAEGITADVGLSYATEPEGGFGSTFGLTGGVSVDFNKLISATFAHSDRIRFRGDIGYYKWEDKVYGVELEYRRIPIFLGGQYVYPLNSTVSFFGEAGLEVSRDRIEVAVCYYNFVTAQTECERESDEETNTGISIGGGALFQITDVFRIGVGIRRHEVSNPYETVTASFGFNF